MSKLTYKKAVQAALGHKYWLFSSFEHYARFVHENLIVEPLIANHPLYAKMIAWVLQNKSPIHFSPTKDYERLTYTGCYNISPVPKRMGRYENNSIFTLFNLHDIAHQMFYYDRRVNSLNTEDFDRNMSLMERVSSNITEVLVYRDIPALRANTREVLPRIWYDSLLEQGVDLSTMTPHTLEKAREKWLHCAELDPFMAPFPKDEPIRKYMANFRDGNLDFLAKRLHRLQKLPKLPQVNFPNLSPYDYEEDLENFTPFPIDSKKAQKQYEWNVLENVKFMYRLMGRDDFPAKFDYIFNFLDEMDTFILLDPAGDE
jgi:hypothetical protein